MKSLSPVAFLVFFFKHVTARLNYTSLQNIELSIYGKWLNEVKESMDFTTYPLFGSCQCMLRHADSRMGDLAMLQKFCG